MADRTTKALLLAIAVGLWMNVASQWLRPVSVQAAQTQTETYIAMISNDVVSIARGSCSNRKIC